jgi:hypothetical protein
MTLDEQINQVLQEATQKIEQLRTTYCEQIQPEKGEWCFFWNNDESFENGCPVMVGRFLQLSSLGYHTCNSQRIWDNCRKIKPEDFNLPSTKPTWEDAPTWAKYLAQDSNGSWYWYADAPTKMPKIYMANGHYAIATLKNDWENSLEGRSE